MAVQILAAGPGAVFEFAVDCAAKRRTIKGGVHVGKAETYEIFRLVGTSDRQRQGTRDQRARRRHRLADRVDIGRHRPEIERVEAADPVVDVPRKQRGGIRDPG
jgi:hypothetical protein